MKKQKVQNKSWIVAAILMLCIAVYSQILFKFNITMTWVVTLIMAISLIVLGEKLTRYPIKQEANWLCLTGGIINVILLTLAIYLIEQGSYITEQSYMKWLNSLFFKEVEQLEFEMGTLILVDYSVFMMIYGKDIWKRIRLNMNGWFPSFFYFVLGVGLVFLIKESTEHMVMTTTILIMGGLLVVHLVFRYISNREQKVIYHISSRQYSMVFMICLAFIVGVGMLLPEYQELPGARWMRKVVSTFSGTGTLQSKITHQTRLNNEFPLSDAVLFEVIASEPLYLRDMAYSDYKDGVWSIPSQDIGLNQYIELKSQYLQAEYIQTESLLDEIRYQHNQNETILPKYAEVATYETSTVHKKKYMIVQNPINKINYFTTNGVREIKDPNSESIYYYYNINNCYFHGQQIVEPSGYTVEYYDHLPKIGSREYLFLRNMNAITWEGIYRKISQNRITYDYYYDKMPKLLLTYTPLVQYKNAKKNFLQIPKELKEPLRALTKTITLSQHSDWANAEAICKYLKNNYTYQLHSKQIREGDHIYNFLFKNKEGICQEFASSMVLMCRSIGIPAKYVTGYRVSEKDSETGHYIVREKDAHAFVEVYIAGYGWMTFDPTPSIALEEMHNKTSIEWNMEEWIILSSVLICLVISILLVKVSYLYLQELVWQRLLKTKKPNKQIEALLNRTFKWLAHNDYNRFEHETLSQYANRLEEEGISITQIIHLYEAYKYGHSLADLEQIKNAYEEYKALKIKLKNK